MTETPSGLLARYVIAGNRLWRFFGLDASDDVLIKEAYQISLTA